MASQSGVTEPDVRNCSERAPVMHTARVVIKPPGQASSGDKMIRNVSQCAHNVHEVQLQVCCVNAQCMFAIIW